MCYFSKKFIYTVYIIYTKSVNHVIIFIKFIRNGNGTGSYEILGLT